jgi:integral membrane protein
MNKSFRWFRNIAFAEGISFIILLFISMPLKYVAKMPMAVTIFGSIHGILFVAFAMLAIEVRGVYKKNFNWLLKAGLASVIPFGTFYMDRQWRREEAEVATE